MAYLGADMCLGSIPGVPWGLFGWIGGTDERAQHRYVLPYTNIRCHSIRFRGQISPWGDELGSAREKPFSDGRAELDTTFG